MEQLLAGVRVDSVSTDISSLRFGPAIRLTAPALDEAEEV